MMPSEVFFKKAKDAIRQGQGKDEAQVVANIRDILFVFLQELPVSLRHKIFNFYYQKFLRQEKESKNIYQLVEMPLRLIDFIKGQDVSDSLAFSDEEWQMVRESINACAESMDLRLLNHLMAVLVENKRY